MRMQDGSSSLDVLFAAGQSHGADENVMEHLLYTLYLLCLNDVGIRSAAALQPLPTSGPAWPPLTRLTTLAGL